MKWLKLLFKAVVFLLPMCLLYVLSSLVLTFVTVNKGPWKRGFTEEVFVSTNGVHLDISMHKSLLHESLRNDLEKSQFGEFYSFGWGEENFYLNTPEWSDLTFSNAINALFLKSPTLMHVTTNEAELSSWVKIPLTSVQLDALNIYLSDSFQKDVKGELILLEGKGYYSNDEFYSAEGSYSCLFTCNSWVNDALKESGMTAAYWTPFDFGVLNKYN